MKLKFLFLIFLELISGNSSKLPQSACKIVGDVIEKENWMKTIAILHFNDKYDAEVIDNFAKCLPSDITVVMIDAMTYNFNLPTTHNVDYVIILADEMNMKKLVSDFIIFSPLFLHLLESFLSLSVI